MISQLQYSAQDHPVPLHIFKNSRPAGDVNATIPYGWGGAYLRAFAIGVSVSFLNVHILLD